MSRDPEDGKIKEPKTLHKYLYAGGDPVNRVDPLGREEYEEEIGFTAPEEEKAVQEVGEEEKQNICLELYLIDLAECEALDDPEEFGVCKQKALLNRYRCEQGLPPI